MRYTFSDVVRALDDPRLENAIGRVVYHSIDKDTLKTINTREYSGTGNYMGIYRGPSSAPANRQKLYFGDETPEEIERDLEAYPFCIDGGGLTFITESVIVPNVTEREYMPEGNIYTAFMDQRTGKLVTRINHNGCGHLEYNAFLPPLLCPACMAGFEKKQARIFPKGVIPVRVRIIVEDEK